MGVYEDVDAALKDAMRARDKDRTRALRGIRALFIEALKEDNSERLSDEKCIELLRRLAKKHAESIDAFQKGGREDLEATERAELAVVEAFLPQLAGEDTVRGWVEAAIASTGASSGKDIGRVMGLVMKEHKGDCDGALVRRIASELLGG